MPADHNTPLPDNDRGADNEYVYNSGALYAVYVAVDHDKRGLNYIDDFTDLRYSDHHAGHVHAVYNSEGKLARSYYHEHPDGHYAAFIPTATLVHDETPSR